jgi:hypothetical protein
MNPIIKLILNFDSDQPFNQFYNSCIKGDRLLLLFYVIYICTSTLLNNNHDFFFPSCSIPMIANMMITGGLYDH